MSAGGLIIHRDLSECAPLFAENVTAGLAHCRHVGLDPIVWEAVRTQELQELYYRRGRPPTTEYPRPVTNVRNAQYGWHFFGLAVDIISESKHWNAGEAWFQHVAEIMAEHDLDWGGDWRMRDLPHFQHGGMKASPSDRARQLYREGGLEAVWQAVGADDPFRTVVSGASTAPRVP